MKELDLFLCNLKDSHWISKIAFTRSRLLNFWKQDYIVDSFVSQRHTCLSMDRIIKWNDSKLRETENKFAKTRSKPADQLEPSIFSLRWSLKRVSNSLFPRCWTKQLILALTLIFVVN